MGLKSPVIRKKKISWYLLSHQHKDGKSKAKFFKHIGLSSYFSLAKALIKLAKNNKIKQKIKVDDGVKYIIEGYVFSPKFKKNIKFKLFGLEKKD